MYLELRWPLSANRYWVVAHNRIILSQAARHYKRAIAFYCLGHNIKPLTGWLKAELILQPPDRRKRDCHNLTKVLFDALQGYAYSDDSQIIDVHIFMRPDDIVTKGRAGLTLSQLT